MQKDQIGLLLGIEGFHGGAPDLLRHRSAVWAGAESGHRRASAPGAGVAAAGAAAGGAAASRAFSAASSSSMRASMAASSFIIAAVASDLGVEFAGWLDDAVLVGGRAGGALPCSRQARRRIRSART